MCPAGYRLLAVYYMPGHIFDPAVTFITAARSSCGVTVQAKSEKEKTGPKDLKKEERKW